MTELDKDLRAFEAEREALEAQHMGKWVVFHQQKLIGAYNDFDSAAAAAIAKFGRGPYLIKQVGAPPVVLPVAVMQAWRDAAD